MLLIHQRLGAKLISFCSTPIINVILTIKTNAARNLGMETQCILQDSQRLELHSYALCGWVKKPPFHTGAGGFALLQSYVILYLEVVVIGAQIHDTLYQTNDAGNVCPAKQQIQNTHTGFA